MGDFGDDFDMDDLIEVDSEHNLLVVKGSVPGKPGALLNIRPALRVGAKPAKGGK